MLFKPRRAELKPPTFLCKTKKYCWFEPHTQKHREKKYLPQVPFKSGVSPAISTGILYKTRKHFINKEDLGIWEKNPVILRHYFISLSKGVGFLDANPTRFFFVSATFISWIWRWLSAWSKYLGSVFSLWKCYLNHHQRHLHQLQFYWYWANSYLHWHSFAGVICNENQKHLWCYPLLPRSLYKIPLLNSRGGCVKSIICHRLGAHNGVGVLASLLPCPA